MFEDWDTLQEHTQNWLFLESTFKITLICVMYLVFVLYAGPIFMKNRPAYSLKNVIMGYNMLQIAVSYYLAKEFLTNGVSFHDFYRCIPVDYGNGAHNMYRATLLYYSFLLKIVELIETVFFVLRKKDKQISVLHVYHHVSTIYITYFGAKFVGCGPGCACMVLNLIVHFFMYTYYLLSSFGDTKWQQNLLFFKSGITKFQIVQFLIMISYSIFLSMNSCIDRICLVAFSIMVPDVILLLYMFVKFYIKSYNTKPVASIAVTNGTKNN